ncbi:MAG: hypothetical protein KKE05_04345, partial [Nanoarchaeota archaeon]|nr:hypothetical protein [Nanoarchaeota archaeon]
MREELIRVLRELDVVYREPVKGVSGKHLDYYVDIKKAYGNPRALHLISELIWGMLDKSTTCIAAMGYGGLSPPSVISAKYGLHLVMVRDSPKQHGRGGFIDGYVPALGDSVVIFDDVFTTGGSLKKVLGVIGQTEAKILGSYVVVKRGEGNVDVPLRWLLTAGDLLS